MLAAAPRRRTTAATSDPQAACGTKVYCKQMASCAEARAFLAQCHLTRLDADDDGIPRETLCA